MRTNDRQSPVRSLLIIAAVVAVVAVMVGALGTLYYLKKASEASPSINHPQTN